MQPREYRDNEQTKRRNFRFPPPVECDGERICVIVAVTRPRSLQCNEQANAIKEVKLKETYLRKVFRQDRRRTIAD